MLFEEYADSHQNKLNQIIHYICVPLIVFSIIGLVTAIPFPKLSFLGKYNMYINWFSFLMAFTIYYYYKLSPVLSYMMLSFFGVSYYFIVQLEYLERDNGIPLWLVSLVIFVVAWIGQFIGHKIEGKKPSFLTDLKFLLIGPIWIFSKVLNKLKLRY